MLLYLTSLYRGPRANKPARTITPVANYGDHYLNRSSQVHNRNHRPDGAVVRASASQSADLGFIPLVESYQKTLKNGIYSFPAWRSAFMGGCGEQAGKFACCVLEQGT